MMLNYKQTFNSLTLLTVRQDIFFRFNITPYSNNEKLSFTFQVPFQKGVSANASGKSTFCHKLLIDPDIITFAHFMHHVLNVLSKLSDIPESPSNFIQYTSEG